MDQTFYEVLNVSPDASPEEIRKAYKKLALRTHPDRAPPENKTIAEEEFRRVNAAYEVLIDKDKRRAYDLHGVWPPPTLHDTYASTADPFHPHRSRYNSADDAFPHMHHRHRSHSQRHATWDPFFGFGPGHYEYRDPFELFNSVFAEFERMHEDLFRTHARMTRSMMDDPFGPCPLFGHSPFGHSPFSLLNDPFFERAFLNDELGMGPSSRIERGHSGGSGARGPREGVRWVRQSQMTRTVNGVTESVLKRVDSEGNEYVTYSYPDGTQRKLVNGVEETQSLPRPAEPRRIEARPQQATPPPSRHHSYHSYSRSPPPPEPVIVPPAPRGSKNSESSRRSSYSRETEGKTHKHWWQRH